MKIVVRTGGAVSVQDMAGFGEAWSNENHLWWQDAAPGDVLEFGLPVTQPVTRAELQITKAADYGIVQLSVDGKPLGGPLDAYNDGVIASGIISLNLPEPLQPGDHVLRVEIKGSNPKAIKRHMFGLDYILLK